LLLRGAEEEDVDAAAGAGNIEKAPREGEQLGVGLGCVEPDGGLNKGSRWRGS